MIHRKKEVWWNQKNKEEEAEQGVNYLSQKKKWKHETLETNHLIYTHKQTNTHSLKRGRRRRGLFFSYLIFTCGLKESCTKPPKLYLLQLIFSFFFVRMERVNKEARREQNPNEEGLHKKRLFFFFVYFHFFIFLL